MHFSQTTRECMVHMAAHEQCCKDFVLKISFHSYANTTNFHMKSFALSLAFIMRFKSNSEMAYFSYTSQNVF